MKIHSPFSMTPYFGVKKPTPEEPSKLSEVEELWNSVELSNTWNINASDNNYKNLFFGPAFFNFIQQQNGDFKKKDIWLDLGCGEGMDCRRLLQMGANRVIGVDLSKPLLDKAKSIKAPPGKKSRYIQGSFTKIPLKNNSVNKCISVMAFMDSPELEEAFQEAFRVLKPGGDFYFILKHPHTNRNPNAFQSQNEEESLPEQSYFNKEPFQKKVTLNATSQYHTLHFPRTMANLLNPLSASGFKIKNINEPFPSYHSIQHEPRLRRYRKDPFCIIVHAQKPKLMYLA